MSKNNKVLVLSEDDAKRRDISTILEFIGEEGIVVGADAHSLLSGGDADMTEPLDEDALLDLERHAFMSLVKRPQTLARIEHMLETGKPLRN